MKLFHALFTNCRQRARASVDQIGTVRQRARSPDRSVGWTRSLGRQSGARAAFPACLLARRWSRPGPGRCACGRRLRPHRRYHPVSQLMRPRRGTGRSAATGSAL